MNTTKKSWIFILGCTLPTLTIYLLFVIYPIIESFKISFYQWSGLTKGTEVFVGFKNFINLFDDPIFYKAIQNNVKLIFIVPIIIVSIALFFSTILTRRKLKEKRLYRTLFFFPNVLSEVVIAVLFSFVFHPSMGVLNSLLEAIGLDFLAQPWLGQSSTALGAVMVAMIWTSIGWFMVLYIAAMEGVPASMYESCRLDGATEWQQFWHVTIPLIWETLRVSFVFLIVSAFNGSFTYIMVMTAGGPDNNSQVLSSYMYSYAFKGGGNTNMGYATAIAVVNFAIIAVITLIAHRISKKEEVTY